MSFRLTKPISIGTKVFSTNDNAIDSRSRYNNRHVLVESLSDDVRIVRIDSGCRRARGRKIGCASLHVFHVALKAAKLIRRSGKRSSRFSITLNCCFQFSPSFTPLCVSFSFSLRASRIRPLQRVVKAERERASTTVTPRL